ncbi:splicing factor 1 [Brevipalpus obovatus]|uniref:splicing factor 1 n=1 Tax=Brevipalpus obovatus TaxID=246614 RepID=UPI003D9E4BF6
MSMRWSSSRISDESGSSSNGNNNTINQNNGSGQYHSYYSSGSSNSHTLPPPPRNESDNSNDSSSEPRRKRTRKSRWGGDENDKVIIPGMPTVLPTNLTPEQEKIYLVQLQIEEISRRLRTGDLGIPDNPEERSPSPEPIYNNEGKRLNTREFRTRKKLEDERHSLIQQMIQLNPSFKPPADYKPPQTKISEKVLIPQEEYPDINFVGLLIGPRGNTLKAMEKDSGAKIIIRGKGSVKEGKIGRKDGQPMPGEDEPLHAFITGSTHESVKKAVQKIEEVIRQGIEVPENQNNLRKMQLRELALLNGTLRENDVARCSNCGSSAHRSWQCPDKPNVTNNVVCSNCNGRGHISRDCKEKRSADATNPDIDKEYMLLMAELGENPPTSAPGPMNQSDSWIKNRTSGMGNFNKRALPESTSTYNQQPPLSPVQSNYPATGANAAVPTWSTTPIGGPPPPPPPGASSSVLSASQSPVATSPVSSTPSAVTGQWASVYNTAGYSAAGYNMLGVGGYGMMIPPPPPPPPPTVGTSSSPVLQPTSPYGSNSIPPPPPSYS